MAAGEVGEMLLRAPQHMVGYWNNPTETARDAATAWPRAARGCTRATSRYMDARRLHLHRRSQEGHAEDERIPGLAARDRRSARRRIRQSWKSAWQAFRTTRRARWPNAWVVLKAGPVRLPLRSFAHTAANSSRHKVPARIGIPDRSCRRRWLGKSCGGRWWRRRHGRQLVICRVQKDPRPQAGYLPTGSSLRCSRPRAPGGSEPQDPRRRAYRRARRSCRHRDLRAIPMTSSHGLPPDRRSRSPALLRARHQRSIGAIGAIRECLAGRAQPCSLTPRRARSDCGRPNRINDGSACSDRADDRVSDAPISNSHVEERPVRLYVLQPDSQPRRQWPSSAPTW